MARPSRLLHRAPLPAWLKRTAPVSRWQQIKSDKATAALAAGTIAIAAAVVVGQYSRLLNRRTHSDDPDETLIASAPAAAVDTVGVAIEGFSAAPRHEVVLFNLLSGFLGSFAVVRLTTWAIRDGRGPFRNVSVGGRHIHHFVPGILIAFASGITGLLVREGKADTRASFTMGIGMGLTFDEAALLLDMRDVYWTREGLLSVQVTLATGAAMGAAILTIRILGRGEQRQEQAGEIPAQPHPFAGRGPVAGSMRTR
jgi:hypothetical protein